MRLFISYSTGDLAIVKQIADAGGKQKKRKKQM